jgi:hypothetical protein
MTVCGLLRLCGVMSLLAYGACGEHEPSSPAERTRDSIPGWTAQTDAERGYSISFPYSWHRATERMSRISEPRELLSLATVRLSWRETDCEAFAGAAGLGMGPGDVVVTVWERGYDTDSDWFDFPARPKSFGPVPNAEPAGPGCGDPPGTMVHWRTSAIPAANCTRWSGSVRRHGRELARRRGRSLTAWASTPDISRTGPRAADRTRGRRGSGCLTATRPQRRPRDTTSKGHPPEWLSCGPTCAAIVHSRQVERAGRPQIRTGCPGRAPFVAAGSE